MGHSYNTAAHRIQSLGKKSHAARLILWDMCDLANDKTGIVYVGYKRLMKRCDVGRESIADALDLLERLGIIIMRKKRSHTCNIYRISLEVINRLALVVPEETPYEEFDDRTTEDKTPESPEKPSAGYGSTVELVRFDERTSNSSISSNGGWTVEPIPGVDFHVERNPDAYPLVLSSAAQLTPTDKSKTRSTPSNSGTTVPAPQSGTSRPETQGGFVPAGASPNSADPQKAPWEIAREKFASGEWEDLDDIAGAAHA